MNNLKIEIYFTINSTPSPIPTAPLKVRNCQLWGKGRSLSKPLAIKPIKHSKRREQSTRGLGTRQHGDLSNVKSPC